MASFPYYSHIFRDSNMGVGGMGIVWNSMGKGSFFFGGVPENSTEVV